MDENHTQSAQPAPVNPDIASDATPLVGNVEAPAPTGVEVAPAPVDQAAVPGQTVAAAAPEVKPEPSVWSKIFNAVVRRPY